MFKKRTETGTGTGSGFSLIPLTPEPGTAGSGTTAGSTHWDLFVVSWGMFCDVAKRETSDREEIACVGERSNQEEIGLKERRWWGSRGCRKENEGCLIYYPDLQ